MSEDNNIYQNRDRLLGEIHSTVKSTKEWCMAHDIKDDDRQKLNDKKFIWTWVSILILGALTGTIPQLTSFALEHFK